MIRKLFTVVVLVMAVLFFSGCTSYGYKAKIYDDKVSYSNRETEQVMVCLGEEVIKHVEQKQDVDLNKLFNEFDSFDKLYALINPLVKDSFADFENADFENFGVLVNHCLKNKGFNGVVKIKSINSVEVIKDGKVNFVYVGGSQDNLLAKIAIASRLPLINIPLLPSKCTNPTEPTEPGGSSSPVVLKENGDNGAPPDST